MMAHSTYLSISCVAWGASRFSACVLAWYNGESRRTLETSRERWEHHGIANYRYLFDSQCFCDQGPVPARIIVRADTLQAVLNPETGDTLLARGSDQPVWTERPMQEPTLDRLFDIIDGELSRVFYRRPGSMHVAYNEDYGYPAYIHIDQRVGGAGAVAGDDELTITVDDLAENQYHRK